MDYMTLKKQAKNGAFLSRQINYYCASEVVFPAL